MNNFSDPFSTTNDDSKCLFQTKVPRDAYNWLLSLRPQRPWGKGTIQVAFGYMFQHLIHELKRNGITPGSPDCSSRFEQFILTRYAIMDGGAAESTQDSHDLRSSKQPYPKCPGDEGKEGRDSKQQKGRQ